MKDRLPAASDGESRRARRSHRADSTGIGLWSSRRCSWSSLARTSRSADRESHLVALSYRSHSRGSRSRVRSRSARVINRAFAGSGDNDNSEPSLSPFSCDPASELADQPNSRIRSNALSRTHHRSSRSINSTSASSSSSSTSPSRSSTSLTGRNEGARYSRASRASRWLLPFIPRS